MKAKHGYYKNRLIKVGDTVRVKDHTEIDFEFISGVGKVVNLYVDSNYNIITLSVDWNDFLKGHNCEGYARNYHGWNVLGKYLDKLIFDNQELNKFHEE